jgi:hypothetical protein
MKHNTDSSQTFDEVKMKISPGDTITSKKGILSESPLTGKFYTWKKGTYRGDGLWTVQEKQEVDVTVSQR